MPPISEKIASYDARPHSAGAGGGGRKTRADLSTPPRSRAALGHLSDQNVQIGNSCPAERTDGFSLGAVIDGSNAYLGLRETQTRRRPSPARNGYG